ncbi:MAG: HEAT repeat domain-containing protein [Planctomycetota bacterium]
MDEKAHIASALLAAAQTDSNPGVRSVASGTLSRTCDPSRVPAVFEMLGSDDPGMRRLAVHSLANCRGEKAENAVLYAVDDPDPAVRKEAILALGNMGDPGLVPKIMGALERETSPEIIGETDPRKDPALKSWAVGVLLRLADEGSRSVFVNYLTHDRPEIRAIAVSVLGKVGDASILPDIRRQVEDGNLPVARAAVEALGGLRDQESVSVLCEIISDRTVFPLLICTAAVALKAIGDKSAIEPLADAQRNAAEGMEEATPGFEDWYWRHQVIARTAEALGGLGAEWRIAPEVLTKLVTLCRTQSHASDARWVLEDVYRTDIGFATEALGAEEMGSEQALLGVFKDAKRLAQLLADHEEGRVRAAAAKHLQSLRDGGSIPKLVEAMKHDRHPDVRRAAAEALSAFRDPALTPELLDRIHREMVPGVRAAAIRTLAGIAGESAKGHLLDLVHDRAAEVRRVALESLTRFPGGEVLKALLGAAKDPDPNVRSAAALGIGMQRAEAALSTMIDLLMNDRHPAPRVSAAAALGLMSSSVAVGSLAAALSKDATASVRSQAARSLGEIGDASVVAKLEDAAKVDPDAGVRSHCVLALGRIAERLFGN